MRLSLLLCLLPLLSGAHVLTPQFSKTSDSVILSKQSELDNSNALPRQIVTFPNMVKTIELTQPEPAEVLKIEALLKSEGVEVENLDDEGFQTQTFAVRGLFVAQFTTKPSRKMSANQVEIPATGSFQLKLTEGPVFKIVDQDATDGSVLIQMPAATLKTWLHLSQNWRQNSFLDIEDPLYYVKDTVSTQKKSWLSSLRWLSVGLRPLPVPTEWVSSYGKDLVLNLTAKNVSSFQMIWLRNDERSADPPFGTKEIGPEGGTLELPGVAKLTIPAGTFDAKQTVRLQEVNEINIDTSSFEGLRTIIGPTVKIEPEGLTFEGRSPPEIELDIDTSRFKDGYSAADLKYISNTGENDLGWTYLGRITENYQTHFEQYNGPHAVDKFNTITAIVHNSILRDFSVSQNTHLHSKKRRTQNSAVYLPR